MTDLEILADFEFSKKQAKQYAENEGLLEKLGRAGRVLDKAKRAELSALVLQICTKAPDQHLDFLAAAIASGDIDKPRISAAVKFASAHSDSEKLEKSAFDAACGVGVVVTPKEIADAVAAAVKANAAGLKEDRYYFNTGKLLGSVAKVLQWADGGELKAEVDKQVVAFLGPKTAEDEKPREKKPKVKSAGPPKKSVKKGGAVKEAASVGVVNDTEQEFPTPASNAARNTPELLAAHLEATGGKVITRFPPEPNGYLHVGHAKAMFLDFGYGKKHGECLLRYDDTNPEAESQEYIDSILNSVTWLGHQPSRVTYSSDYFDKLYDLAVELIKRGKAYVCHQTAADTAEYRRARKDSPWRDRPVAENLRLFNEMRQGVWAEGSAWLRMKIDMKSDNPCMRDPCAYRIKCHPHPRTGDTWIIYPAYDFVHCIVDSLENVTHSLCTLEFDIRRESYYWLLDALNLYRPLVWEFSRLMFEDRVHLDDQEWLLQTTLSKRRLLKLVESGHARGWDDPRMPTVDGLKRRGFTPASINALMEAIGVTRGTQRIPMTRLEQQLRLDLDPIVERRTAVLRPLKVTISNFDQVTERVATLAIHPSHPERGSRTLPVTQILFIDRDDFRMEDDKNFYGLAPNKEVGLRNAGNIVCEKVIQAADGTVTELIVSFDQDKKNKTKGHLHWLPDPAQANGAVIKAEIRLYEWLFHTRVLRKSDDEEEAKNDAEAIKLAAATKAAENPDDEGEDADDGEAEPIDSEIVLTDALVEASVSREHFSHVQFERVGFFVVDPDSTKDALVMNRTCTLKESSGKKKLK